MERLKRRGHQLHTDGCHHTLGIEYPYKHKNTFKSSVEGLYRTIQEDYTQHGYTNNQTYTISATTITNTSDDDREDSSFVFSGKLDKGSGTATVTYDKSAGKLKIEMKVQNNTFCADNSTKDGRNEYVITKGACS